MLRVRLTVALATIVSLAACASTPTYSATGSAPVHRAPSFTGSMLTAADFSKVSSSDLFQAIESLRPSMLTPRGGMVSVAVDGVITGDAAILRGIPARVVASVRLLNGPEATMRFGSHHAGAVLAVTTRMR